MPYQILRLTSGWITNDNGDFLLEDTDNCRIWISNNLIAFNERNEPFIREENQEDGEDPAMLGIKYLSEDNIENKTDDDEENSNATSNKKGDKKNCVWSVNETNSLLTAVEARYEDMHHIQKRKHFWNIISEELGSLNIVFTSDACKKKWLNLVRTYKNTKDIKTKTGRGPVRFEYFNRLDEMLGDSPSNASSHSIDVSTIENNSSPQGESSCATTNNSSKKRKNPTTELNQIKKQFYKEKTEQNKEKENNRKWYIEESLRHKQERSELYKTKLDMEERKLKVLEELRDMLKNKNV